MSLVLVLLSTAFVLRSIAVVLRSDPPPIEAEAEHLMRNLFCSFIYKHRLYLPGNHAVYTTM